MKLDLPAMVIVALAFWLMSLDGALSRLDGVALIALGVLYTALLVRGVRSRRSFLTEYRDEDNPGRERREIIQHIAALVGGIIVIVLGADWSVDGSVALARLWGVFDAFIGLTVVAIGTSSPELVTILVSTPAAAPDIAVGNLLGRSVYNIVFILGLRGVGTGRPRDVRTAARRHTGDGAGRGGVYPGLHQRPRRSCCC